jgi:flagellar FliJ protein
MVPSKRFEPVKRIAESREQKAARDLGNSQRRAKEQEAKLAELKQYHDEYLRRFQDASRNGISIPQLQEYRTFIGKLERAISEQQKIVERSRHECGKYRDAWQQRHVRTQALDKVMDRLQSAERRRQDDREQKEQDDRSQRGGGKPRG